MEIIKKLPKKAVYDYRDVNGYDIYHTERKIYRVKGNVIKSYEKKEYNNI